MKKFFSLLVIITSLLTFSGCSSIGITDVQPVSLEVKNPTKVVYGTNRTNYDEQNQIYKDPIEYEIPEDSVKAVVNKLLSLTYKKYEGNIDASPINDYILMYNEDNNFITIQIGSINEDGMHYELVGIDAFIDYLMQVVTPKGGKFYTIQEAYDQGLLTLENLNLLHKYHERVQIQLELDSIFEGAIKKTRLAELINDYPNATLENINIDKYYGKYESAYAVKISVTFYIYGGIVSETIEGLEFVFNGPSTLIWCDTK